MKTRVATLTRNIFKEHMGEPISGAGNFPNAVFTYNCLAIRSGPVNIFSSGQIPRGVHSSSSQTISLIFNVEYCLVHLKRMLRFGRYSVTSLVQIFR